MIALLASTKSIFYTERDAQGKLQLKGGAGGATGLGAAIALWPYSAFFIFPIAALVFVLVGYASVTTISVVVVSTILFAVRAVCRGRALAVLRVWGVGFTDCAVRAAPQSETAA